MAKSNEVNIAAQCRQIVDNARKGVFSGTYLLMGEESYYPDLVCDALVKYCVPDEEKDFNQTICYGDDVTADQVMECAMRYPMMSERQLVVVKDVQRMRDYESLEKYLAKPSEFTVLVLLFRSAGPDKRKSFYKTVLKAGATVVDSPAMRDYQMPSWISAYYRSVGLEIAPDAAALLAEHSGTDLSRIVTETDKLRKSLPEGRTSVSVSDIEDNVGISRECSIFELSNALLLKDRKRAMRVAANLGNQAKFFLPMGLSAIFPTFQRLLRYEAFLRRSRNISREEMSRALPGVPWSRIGDYETGARNYPLPKTMEIISLLCRYDFLAKGGDGARIPDDELLKELCIKILNA